MRKTLESFSEELPGQFPGVERLSEMKRLVLLAIVGRQDDVAGLLASSKPTKASVPSPGTRTVIAELRTEMQELRTEVRADIHALENRLSSVDQRLARAEGLLEGLRDAITTHGRRDPRGENEAT